MFHCFLTQQENQALDAQIILVSIAFGLIMRFIDNNKNKEYTGTFQKQKHQLTIKKKGK